MSLEQSLQISRWFLAALGTRMFLHHENRIPRGGAVLLVSNHRSFLDAPLLMAALQRPVRFACHHYMGNVPVMREIITTLGGFPLDAPHQRQQGFFQQAIRLLQAQEVVGVFPEGAQPMVEFTQAQEMREFHRGFAHLAFRAPLPDLAVLPVAIAPFQEQVNPAIPLQLLSWFDPSEPLFQQSGWHPLVVYQRVNVLVGQPWWISAKQRQQYQGKAAKPLIADLTHYCHAEISHLLDQGCY